MSYFVRFLLLCCTVALAIPTYANALNERDAVVSRQTGKLQIRVHYPITGNARVDADVADWAHQAVAPEMAPRNAPAAIASSRHRYHGSCQAIAA